MIAGMRFHTLILSLALVASASAFAADKPKKEGSFGTAKPGGGYLTKEQLRGCLAQQPRLAQQEGEVQKEKGALVALKADITRSGDALKERLDSLDRTSAEAVAAYNEQAQARDRQIDDYQARVTAFNGRAEVVQTERDAFAKGCENRRYFEEDEIAIKKGR